MNANQKLPRQMNGNRFLNQKQQAWPPIVSGAKKASKFTTEILHQHFEKIFEKVNSSFTKLILALRPDELDTKTRSIMTMFGISVLAVALLTMIITLSTTLLIVFLKWFLFS
jgi:hypothetical protein